MNDWLHQLSRQLAIELPRVPDKAILAAGKHLPGGFRHAQALRIEIKRRLNGGLMGHKTTAFKVLAESLPEFVLLRDAPAASVRDLEAELEQTLGHARWLLQINSLPASTFKTHPEAPADGATESEEEKETASPEVTLLPEPLPAAALDALRDLLAGASAPATVEAPASLPAAEAHELAEARAALAKLADKLKEATATIDDLRRRRHELKDAHAEALAKAARAHAGELETLRERLRTTEQTLELQRRELASTQSKIETLAKARFDALYDEEVAPWLARAKEEHHLVTTHRHDWKSLLDAARAAETAQQEYDRAAGNRIEMLDTLEKLRAAVLRLDRLRAASLHPIAALLATREKLVHEIRELEQKLTLAPSPACSLTEELHRAIGTASAAKLRQLKESLKTLHAADALSAANQRRLEQAADARLALLLHTAPPDTQAHPSPPTTLREVLKRRTPATVFIDGHNLLFQWIPELGLKRDRAHHPENREKLRRAIGVLAAKHPETDFRLVFDGNHPVIQNDAHLKNLRMEFSGRSADGTRQNKADAFIISTARHLRAGEPGRIIVAVSDDGEIRRDLKTLQGLVADNADLLRLIPTTAEVG